MLTLREKIQHRIALLEGCSHQMCSSSDEASEANEAISLRQLLCDHTAWKVYEGSSNSWVKGERQEGAYCADCGIANYAIPPPLPPPSSAEDLTDLRTRLLKRHAEELAKEIAELDLAFEKAMIVLVAISDTGDDDVMQRLSMVSNVKDAHYLRGLLHFAGDLQVIKTRTPFAREH